MVFKATINQSEVTLVNPKLVPIHLIVSGVGNSVGEENSRVCPNFTSIPFDFIISHVKLQINAEISRHNQGEIRHLRCYNSQLSFFESISEEGKLQNPRQTRWTKYPTSRFNMTSCLSTKLLILDSSENKDICLNSLITGTPFTLND